MPASAPSFGRRTPVRSECRSALQRLVGSGAVEKVRPARLPYPVRVMRFAGPMLRYGIVTREALGVRIQVTSPARTIVDCFRYRNKIGLDVALEALRDVLRRRTVSVDAIVRAAEVCHVSTVIRPYLEAAAS